jgi:hypothetical protein
MSYKTALLLHKAAREQPGYNPIATRPCKQESEVASLPGRQADLDLRARQRCATKNRGLEPKGLFLIVSHPTNPDDRKKL